MHRRKVVTALGTMCLFAAMNASSAGEGPLQARLVGTWEIRVVDNVSATGERSHLYGDRPLGIATFDSNGFYSLLIMRAGRPKFAAGDKSKGTPEEYKAAIQGTNCHFGSYFIDEERGTVTLSVEGATFANWEGRELIWPISVDADEATLTIPHPTTGGANVAGEVRMKRLP